MRPKLALVLGLACLAGPAIAGSPPAAEPSIVAVFPNPVADGDAGEYVVLDVAGSAGENLTLSDGEQTVAVPSIETEQRLVLTGSADAVPSIVDGRIVELPEWPELANGGERLVLSRNDRTLDAVRYEDAPEGERGTPGPTGLTWEPLGATDLDPLAGGPARLRAFTLPDAPGVPIETLRGADRRLLLAGYTLTSRRVADALVEAADRGVDVAVLVDAAPVGGLTNRSAAILDRLAATNVTVNVVGGETSPYRFHHAKYAVVDDRAVVLTENWKPAGTGGRSSRGWGVVVEERSVVDGLRETFRADSRDRTAVPWERFRANATLEPARRLEGATRDASSPSRSTRAESNSW